MKAWEIREFGIRNLRLVDREVPMPGTGEVLVRFHAASVNYRDLMVVTGTYNPRMKLPAIPFSDGAGEVSSVGSGVTKWKVGDRVMPIFAQRWIDGEPTEEKRRTSLGSGPFWDGVLREFGSFDAEAIVRIPDHLSFIEAATLPCAGVTAWHAVIAAGSTKPGDTVLTLGTGGVSIFAIQFARMAGADVVSTSGSAAKIGRLGDLGVAKTVNYRDTDDWDNAVLDMTEGRGADLTVEVGGAGTLQRSVNATRFGGRVAMIGALTGAVEFNPTTVFMKSIRLQGVFTGPRTMFEDMNRAISVNQLKPVVDQVFDFDQIPEALEYMRAGAHFGKIAVQFR